MMLSRSDRSSLSIWLWTIDKWIFFSFFTLLLLGIIFILTSSSTLELKLNKESYYFSIKHIIFVILSFLIAIILSELNSQKIKLLSLISFGLLLASLLYCIHYSSDIKGAKRWIEIFDQSLQPSEFIKPFFIIVNAWLLTIWKSTQKNKYLVISILAILSIDVMLLLQPDLGMTLLITSIWIFQLLITGIPILFLVFLIFLIPTVILLAYNFYSHVYVRINDFLFGTNFQANQALKLFNDAGYFGKGIGEGSLKINLPDAHTDFIFSVIAEEFGIIICLMIIFIYTIIILRPIIIAFNCKDIFQILSLSSLSALIGVQSLIHISSNLSIIPTKGMTLPFLSYGGSSTISAAIAIGFLLSLTKKQIHFSEVDLDIENYK